MTERRKNGCAVPGKKGGRALRRRLALALLTLMLPLCACMKPSAPAAAAAPLASAPVKSAAPAAAAAPAPEPTPTPKPTPEPTPEPTAFSIAWMSDTQGLNGVLFAAVEEMYKWITTVREDENVAALVHTGDIVQNVYDEAHWQRNLNAAQALPPEILRVTACGNHDYSPDALAYTNYLRYRFDSPIPPENTFLDGKCFYQTLHAGGMDVLLLSIAYFTERESVEWACDVLAAHPGYFGILLVHSYLVPNQEIPENGYGSAGFILRDGVVKRCPNLRMVLCGHNHGVVNKEAAYDDDGDGAPDRTVYELMMNYQEGALEDLGFMRLIRFDPAADTITLVTYSPFLAATHPQLHTFRPDVVYAHAGLS